MVLCCFIFLIVFFGYFFSLTSFYVSSQPPSQSLSQWLPGKGTQWAFWPEPHSQSVAAATISSSCHHQQMLSATRAAVETVCSQQRLARCLLKKLCTGRGWESNEANGGKFEWMETFPEGSRKLLLRVSGLWEMNEFTQGLCQRLFSPQGTEYGRGWKKKKVFKTSRRKEKMPREKQREKEAERNESLFSFI